MITAQNIHDWLQEPAAVPQHTESSLRALAREYPFFAPIGLLLQFIQNGNSRNLRLEELYNHNPVVYHFWNEPLSWDIATAASEVSTAVEEEEEEETSTQSASTLGKVWQHFEEEHLLEHEKKGVEHEYFSTQGINVSHELPKMQEEATEETEQQADKSLMVVMTFAEWLQFLQRKSIKEREEEEEKRALKAQWQKQKMAEAIEEETDEIPPTVFEMAVNSISRDESIVSESMAVVYEKQGKIAEAANIYKKLILNNPDKSAYFAGKIERLQKDI